MPPPDPSQANQFEQRIRDIVNAVLSDPMSYPDPMVSWFNEQINLVMPATTSSTTGVNTQPPTV